MSGAAPSAAPSARLTAFAALRHRDFAVFALARFCTTLSWQILGAAVGWQVYQLTRDPLSLAFVGLVQFVPFILLVLPAGQLADRVDRRLVLIGAYAVEASCSAVLLWFTLSGNKAVWPVFVAMTLFGCGRAFWMPTGQAITPNLVPVETFPSAVAVNSSLFQTGVIVGPALGGLLLIWGPHAAYVTALCLLTFAVILIATIKPVRSSVPAAPFKFGDVLEGLRFVIRRRTVLGAISLDLFAVLFGGATAMMPIYATEVLHVGTVGYGMLRSAPGVGAALMAAVLAFSPLQRHVGRWMFAGVALFGVSTIVFGISKVFWVSAIALFLLGMGDMVSVFVRHLLVQLETPDVIRGRVSAVSSMFIGASNELGEFESGVTARALGLIPSVVLGGIATLLVVAAYLKLFPELRRMDEFPRAERFTP
ncbi:MAG TPA: MFS transporter [Steroidobacteraceae bacterium]|nr:MFS transporter [Steroidobacteraceae bacterium]